MRSETGGAAFLGGLVNSKSFGWLPAIVEPSCQKAQRASLSDITNQAGLPTTGSGKNQQKKGGETMRGYYSVLLLQGLGLTGLVLAFLAALLR